MAYTLHRFYYDGAMNPSFVDYGDGFFQAESLEEAIEAAQRELSSPTIIVGDGREVHVAISSDNSEENTLTLGNWTRAFARVLYAGKERSPQVGGERFRRSQLPPFRGPTGGPRPPFGKA